MEDEDAFNLSVLNSDSFSLITWVATYRAFKTARKGVLSVMKELDRRRLSGQTLPFEDLIEIESNFLKLISLGEGFIIKSDPVILNEITSDIKKITHCMILNKSDGIIYIGNPTLEIKTKLEEKGYKLENAKSYISPGLSSFRQNSK